MSRRTVESWLRWPTALALVAALQCVVFSCGCADSLLLHPTHGAFPGGATLERREIACRDGALETWVARAGGDAAAAREIYVLAFDGNASRAEAAAQRVARLFDDRAVEVWAVNYPGYGGSAGVACLHRLAPAALAAYDELARAAGSAPICIYGNSIGAAVALHVVAKRPVAAAVLQNPPPLRRLILRRHGWWNLWLLALPVALSLPVELDALAGAETARAPAVFVTARDDAIVPAAYQDVVVDAYGGPKRRVWTDGGHNDAIAPATREAVRAALREFLPAP